MDYPTRKLVLTNGVIDLAGFSDGIGVPPRLSETATRVGLPAATDAHFIDGFVFSRKWLAEVIRRPTDNIVDNMSIKAGLTGVTMMGQRNIIRNSRIEMKDALAAINLFGPDNLIENNILIFRGKGRRPSAAPVILHAGGRTVIRNNVIIIDSPRPSQAVSLTASDGVVLENNRVYGALRFVREFDQLSSFVSRGNRVLAPAPDGLVPPGARRADEVPLY